MSGPMGERWCITSPFMETPMPTTFGSRESAEAFIGLLQGGNSEWFQNLSVERVSPQEDNQP